MYILNLEGSEYYWPPEESQLFDLTDEQVKVVIEYNEMANKYWALCQELMVSQPGKM